MINLNGPQHQINSDTLPPGSIIRFEEFLYEKLIMYGYKKYNIINWEEWEKADRYEKTTENLVINKIMNPITIKINNN